MKRASFIVLLALAACGPETTWVRDGATPQNLQRDSYDCEKDARQSGYFGSTLEMRGFFERCLVARGWRKEVLNAPTK